MHTFANSLGRVHLGAIFHGVDRKVDLGKRLLLANGTDSIVNLDVAALLVGDGRIGAAVILHGGLASGLGGANTRAAVCGTICGLRVL